MENQNFKIVYLKAMILFLSTYLKMRHNWARLGERIKSSIEKQVKLPLDQNLCKKIYLY